MDVGIFLSTLSAAAIIYLALSIIVIKARHKSGAAYGLTDDRSFNSKIRAHGNFSEYTPICLILLLTLSLEELTPLYFGLICFIFILGRVFHAVGLIYFEQQNQPSFIYRQIGMALTFATIIFSVIAIISFIHNQI